MMPLQGIMGRLDLLTFHKKDASVYPSLKEMRREAWKPPSLSLTLIASDSSGSFHSVDNIPEEKQKTV